MNSNYCNHNHQVTGTLVCELKPVWISLFLSTAEVAEGKHIFKQMSLQLSQPFLASEE